MTSTYSARQVDGATAEQLLRWKAIEWESTDYSRDGSPNEELRATVVNAATNGTRDEFAQSVGELRTLYRDWNGPHFVSAALKGDEQFLAIALESNPDLQALRWTVTERAGGHDVAEIATSNGLRLRAEYTGETYETAVLVEDTPGRSDVLASGTVAASSATEALRAAAAREHAVQGLDRTDLGLIERQLARLDQLTGSSENDLGPSPSDLGDRWAAAVVRATGLDLRAEPGWTTLGATLDRAAEAGWDVQTQLLSVAAATPLIAQGSASGDLVYQVMDACPDAVPPAPSLAGTNGTEAASTERQRETPERAIAQTPATDRGPTVGR